MELIELGSWIMLAMASAALIFSVACFRMILTILRHVLKFNPGYIQSRIEEIHEEVTNDEES